MHALDGLRQLHLVAEEHDVARCQTHGHQVAQRNLARFVHETAEIERLLASGLEIERLGSRGMVQYLHGFLNLTEQPVAVPDYPVSLEPLVISSDFELGREIRVGERVVSSPNLPFGFE